MDNAARDVQKKKDGYIGNLKAGSDKAITGEIYELAKGDPEIMQTLMTNGKQENLAEPTESNPNEMEYAQEGRELQNNADTPLGQAAATLYEQFVEQEDGKGRDFSAMLPRFEKRHRS